MQRRYRTRPVGLAAAILLLLFLTGCANGAVEEDAPPSAEVPEPPPLYTYTPGVVEAFLPLERVRSSWTETEQSLLPPRVEVKGIYLTSYTASKAATLNPLLALIERTELNAVVVDVKDDWGYITFAVDHPLAVAAGAVHPDFKEIKAFTAMLREKGIYSIARVVTFKDNRLTRSRPDLAVQHVNGGIWRDYNGVAWLNPYDKRAWDYVVEISKAAALAGFDEIQFDYVRFPTDGPMHALVYPGRDDRKREQVIGDFLAYARKELRPYRVWTSADIFGWATSVPDDVGIGHRIEEVSAATDYISPMVYPSHYAPGNLGLANPNAMPYETIYRSMTDVRARWEKAGLTGQVGMRPWLQDFSWGHPYGPAEVRAQIQAVYDAGYKEWLLWNAANLYTEGALLPAQP